MQSVPSCECRLFVQHNIWEASTAKYSWVGWKGEATSSRNNINLINSRVLREDFFSFFPAPVNVM